MKTIALAIGAGLASALLYLAVTAGTLMAIPLFYLAPLPIMIAGFGWGTAAAWIAALAGVLTMSATGLQVGAVYAGACAVPAAFLARLAMLGRPRDPADPASPLEWYPLGRMLLWCAAYGTALSLVFMAFLGFDTARLTETLAEMLRSAQEGDNALPMAPPEGFDADSVAGTMAALIPRFFALIWMWSAVLNLWLAAKITAASGKLQRPASLFAGFSVPRAGGLALLVGIPLSLTGGAAGLVGTIVTAAFASVFAVGGIIVIHHLTQGKPWRPAALGALYCGLLIFTGWLILPLAMVGLADSIFDLRRGKPARGSIYPKSPNSDRNEGE